MRLVGREIELVIFDLDGTLIESTSLWTDVDRKFFARRNMTTPPNYGKEIAHLGLLNAARLTREKYLPNEREEDIINEWHQLALEAYRFHIPLKENVVELLELLKSLDVRIALATANNRDLYDPCLRRLDIKKYFEVIMDVNSCKSGKNSPEIYDKISNLFSLDRDQVAVIEDMLTALKTAFDNGYTAIGIYDKNSVINVEDNKNNSHIFIENYRELIEIIKKENDIQ